MANDLYNVEMKDLNELAYDWNNQTVLRRFEDSIRLLTIHGILSSTDNVKAWGKLQELKMKNRN